MPIIKSAKKRVRSSAKKQARNYASRSQLKTSSRNVLDSVKEGSLEKAESALKAAYKSIDTACKKNILHKNTAARKKSGLAKKVAGLKKAEKKN
ncbi:MAG: 30S ribosomal protein S20 [Candidatus Gracilibacteria bacterium]|nr:30S ribosomal protein S20 [Candidatus Gracilibacteria bacterium]